MLSSLRMVSFVPTTDMDRALEFYRDRLQLEFQFQDQFAAVFTSGGSTLRVVRVNAFEPAPFTVAGWAVEDVPKVVHWLRDQGVEFLRVPGLEQDELGIWHPGDGTHGVAWFRDPAGNILSVSSG